ncbi:hypothetical protein NEOLEDRAFT_1125842 [Neolentinus lepideus HHB14362 ss-1]|uniref:Uncharacterized protein n=1 Tax=Neolentinus lepideus HHB14362 ss-1 TaxID=1314782 RepID=A0A165VX73_9AGAM|nr:hypothetical protein NEOLEDRAFT_1125842 [Neolentinus lepideus HHB14362 ss-1]
MASPSHSKNASRSRLSFIFQLATSHPGGANTLKKKKQSTSHRHRDPTSSAGTGQDIDTDYDVSSGPYEAGSYTSPVSSFAASSSALSIPGSRTPFASSVNDFGGSTSQCNLSSTDIPPLPAVPTPKVLDQKERMKLLKKARKLSKMLGDFAIPSAPPSPNRDAQGFSVLQESGCSPRSPTLTDNLSRTSSRTYDARTPMGHGVMPFARPYTPSESPHTPSFPPRHSHDQPFTRPPAFIAQSSTQNLPTELVLRPSSPPGKRNMSNTSSTSRRKNKRRLSLDLSSLVNSGQSILSPTMPEPPKSPLYIPGDISGPVIKRSRSLWSTKMSQTRNSEEDMMPSPSQAAEERHRIFQDLRSTRSGSLLSEKQRVLNVKRARKMAQLFGSEPPHDLFQTTNVNDLSDDESSQLSPITENRRDSIASTLLYITPPNSGPGSPSSSHLTPRERRRPHSIASSVISVLPHQSDAPASHTPPPFSALVESASGSGRRPSSSHSRHRASSSESDIAPLPSFRQRRLRAAKLTRFFGVDLQQLEPEMTSSKERLPLAGLSRSASLSTNLYREPDEMVEYLHPPESEGHEQVDVKVVSRPGLFGWGSNQRDVDVSDVRVKLRRMRAAR